MWKPPIRFWIAVMIFFTTFTNYMLRANMSVSIVRMNDQESKNFTPPCLRGKETEKSNTTKNTEHIDKVFKWTETEVGNILAAYFWGYIVTVIPGGILSELLGPTHVILWTSVGQAIITALTPLSTELGSDGVIANRFFVGFLGGVAYPAINVLIAKWAPPKEKGKFLAAMMGNTLGSVVSFNMVGMVTQDYGWKWGFYCLVIVMGLFCIVFAILVRDTPEKHPWVSDAEKQFIKDAQEGHVSSKKKVPPYFKILKSFPFWTSCVAQFGNLWGLNLILVYGPKFMSETLGFNLKASAGLAALPYLARLFFSQGFGFIGDLARKKEWITPLTRLRKFFIIFSHLIPAICLFLIIPLGCDPIPVVILMILNQGFNGAVVVSHLINPQDIAPNFSGTVYGMMNFAGMTTGLFIPVLNGAIIDYYNMELAASAVIYAIGGCVMGACGIYFMIFAKAEVQSWNEIKDDTQPKPE